jgi:CAAX prenyl protease-like protein
MPEGKRRYPDIVPYLGPYLLFLVITAIAGEITAFAYISYPVRAVLVAAAVVFFWKAGDYPELDFRPSLLGIAAGFVGFVLWVAPEPHLQWLPKIGGTSSFDPYGAGAEWFVPLVVLRTAEATLLVPIFEELFLRSFLHRYLEGQLEDNDDWKSLPIGRYRFWAFVGVVVAMAITHHRWLRAGLYSALMCFVLYRQKRMGPVIWAHAITNLLLWIYVLLTGEWFFW